MKEIPRLIGVTDRKLCAEPLVNCIEAACRAGLPALQLREKDLSFAEFAALAGLVSKITRRYGTALYLNLGDRSQATSRLAIAGRVGAAGFQVPGGSLTVREVRAAAGPSLQIAVSVHEGTEAFREEERPDFAIAAPVWAPEDKPSSQPLGLEGLRKLSDSLGVPVLALGGITVDRVADVLAAGAAGVAVRSGLFPGTGGVEFSVQAYLSKVAARLAFVS